MNKVFYLSGGLGDSSGLGDCVYALPAVRAMGGGIFVYGGAKKSYLMLKDLFELQPYISACLHVSEIDLPRDFITLDLFRNSPLQNNGHLVNAFLDFFGYPHYDWSSGGWLQTGDDSVAHGYGIINVTPRYRDKVFMKIRGWKQVASQMAAKDIRPFFMGSKKEYELFLRSVNPYRILHREADDLLDAARVIKGAALFAGTQSALMAIRQGLGLPYMLEQSPNHVDVCQYSTNETILNPTTRKIHLAYATLKRLFDPRK